MTEIIVTTVVIAVLGVPFILLWWKIADQWADEEHRRFGRTKPPEGPAPRVVRGERPVARLDAHLPSPSRADRTLRITIDPGEFGPIQARPVLRRAILSIDANATSR